MFPCCLHGGEAGVSECTHVWGDENLESGETIITSSKKIEKRSGTWIKFESTHPSKFAG